MSSNIITLVPANSARARAEDNILTVPQVRAANIVLTPLAQSAHREQNPSGVLQQSGMQR